MTRTVGELRELMRDIPDEAGLWAYEGEVCGIVFSLYGECDEWNNFSSKGGKYAFFDNEKKEEDEEWK